MFYFTLLILLLDLYQGGISYVVILNNFALTGKNSCCNRRRPRFRSRHARRISPSWEPKYTSGIGSEGASAENSRQNAAKRPFHAGPAR